MPSPCCHRVSALKGIPAGSIKPKIPIKRIRKYLQGISPCLKHLLFLLLEYLLYPHPSRNQLLNHLGNESLPALAEPYFLSGVFKRNIFPLAVSAVLPAEVLRSYVVGGYYRRIKAPEVKHHNVPVHACLWLEHKCALECLGQSFLHIIMLWLVGRKHIVAEGLPYQVILNKLAESHPAHVKDRQ